MKYRIPNRRGFTLVELMVAAALSLVIMTIMAVAFQSAMSTLSTLKATGDQADRLRTAEVMLRADLNEDHIVGDDAGGTVKVSDLRFDLGAAFPSNGRGYFKVTTGSVSEGSDSDGIVSTKSNGATNALTMTVKRSSRTSADLFGTTSGGGFVGQVSDTLGTSENSQWAEVKWQLGTKHSIGGVDMWPLHRTVRVFKGTGTFPTMPTNAALQPATATGDDIVLTNVISFEVKPLLPNTAVGIDAPYSDTTFDTSFTSPAKSSAETQKLRCVAVQVKIRLFDIKTKLTRQMTLIVKI